MATIGGSRDLVVKELNLWSEPTNYDQNVLTQGSEPIIALWAMWLVSAEHRGLTAAPVNVCEYVWRSV